MEGNREIIGTRGLLKPKSHLCNKFFHSHTSAENYCTYLRVGLCPYFLVENVMNLILCKNVKFLENS